LPSCPRWATTDGKLPAQTHRNIAPGAADDGLGPLVALQLHLLASFREPRFANVGIKVLFGEANEVGIH